MTKKLSLAALALISACYFTACDDDSSPSSAKSEPASSASVEAADDAESSAEAAENEAKDDEKAPESAKEDAKPASSASADKEEAKSSASIKDALSSAKENLGDIGAALEGILGSTKVECTGEESDNEWTMNVNMTVEGIKMITATKSVFEGTTMNTETTASTALGDKLTCEASLLAAKAQYAQEYDNVEASCDKDGTMIVKYTDSMENVNAEKKAELYKEFKSACEADMSDISFSDLM